MPAWGSACPLLYERSARIWAKERRSRKSTYVRLCEWRGLNCYTFFDTLQLTASFDIRKKGRPSFSERPSLFFVSISSLFQKLHRGSCHDIRRILSNNVWSSAHLQMQKAHPWKMSSGAAHSQRLRKIPACSYRSFRLSFNLLLSYPAGTSKSVSAVPTYSAIQKDSPAPYACRFLINFIHNHIIYHAKQKSN